jgi:hypothetical protein
MLGESITLTEGEALDDTRKIHLQTEAGKRIRLIILD